MTPDRKASELTSRVNSRLENWGFWVVFGGFLVFLTENCEILPVLMAK
jgi:hypothetical protein